MIDGRRVVWFRIAGGKHHGAIGVAGGATVERAVQLAGQLQVPLVGELDTSGAELGEGVAALHAWGRLARELVAVSGVVPTLLAVTGACVSGPALALGLLRPGRDDRRRVRVRDRPRVGRRLHRRSGVAHRARRQRRARPPHRRRRARRARRGRSHATRSSRSSRISPTTISPIRRAGTCDRRPIAAVPRSRPATIPDRPNASYDVRDVIDDVARRRLAASSCAPATRRTS